MARKASSNALKRFPLAEERFFAHFGGFHEN
jgi:hypothetical protein